MPDSPTNPTPAAPSAMVEAPLANSCLQAIANGHTDAMQRLLKAHGNLVWALALKHCPDRGHAEDAVQEIFAELWQTAHRFDPAKASETTFVAMVARRRLIDRHRRAAVRPHNQVVADSPFERTADTPDIPERLAEQEQAATAEQLLEELGPPANTCIRLAVHEGHTHQAIAEKLNLPLGSVKSHIRRGLLKLREQLQSPPTQEANQ